LRSLRAERCFVERALASRCTLALDRRHRSVDLLLPRRACLLSEYPFAHADSLLQLGDLRRNVGRLLRGLGFLRFLLAHRRAEKLVDKSHESGRHDRTSSASSTARPRT
jgi:hypothetical protein